MAIAADPLATLPDDLVCLHAATIVVIVMWAPATPLPLVGAIVTVVDVLSLTFRDLYCLVLAAIERALSSELSLLPQ